MKTVALVAKVEIAVILAGILSIFAFRLLTGQLITRDLLAKDPDGPVSAERVQLLVATLGAAGYLLISLSRSAPYHMTLPSGWLLLLFGGSNGAYLIAKYWQGAPSRV